MDVFTRSIVVVARSAARCRIKMLAHSILQEIEAVVVRGSSHRIIVGVLVTSKCRIPTTSIHGQHGRCHKRAIATVRTTVDVTHHGSRWTNGIAVTHVIPVANAHTITHATPTHHHRGSMRLRHRHHHWRRTQHHRLRLCRHHPCIAAATICISTGRRSIKGHSLEKIQEIARATAHIDAVFGDSRGCTKRIEVSVRQVSSGWLLLLT